VTPAKPVEALGVLVGLVFVGTSLALFCFLFVGAVRKELADQEARLSGTVYTAEQSAVRRRRRAHRGWLLVLAVALLIAAGPLLPAIS
jgi:hypothetical protein